MSEYEHFIRSSEDMVCNNPAGQDDITVVLAVLQGLLEKSSHLIVRVSLEQAYDDIVHLTSNGDGLQDGDQEICDGILNGHDGTVVGEFPFIRWEPT